VDVIFWKPFAGLIGVTVLLGAGARKSGAEGLGGTVRIKSPTAAIMSRPAVKGEVFAVASAETLLDTIDREGDWYWVLLPADVNGTRYSGWIHIADVEVETAGKVARPGAVRNSDEKRQKEKDRQMEKVKRELEKARRDYEKVTGQQPVAAISDAPALADSGGESDSK
jgi:hypothetical protein